MRWFATLIVVCACAVGTYYLYKQALAFRYRVTYPYGATHCCDKLLLSYLRLYANSHDGQYPHGETSPEASLSLLVREFPDERESLIDLLRGKTVHQNVVRARIERGELLDANSCGWHYVEGLRFGDDLRLALFWDKIGLGHNGERLPEGGHFVFLINGIKEYIPEVKWQDFLREQEELHRKLPEMRAAAQRKSADSNSAESQSPVE